MPVYEVYKVGQDVQILEGLDILSAIGVNAAVIPHYDNAEGGNHDTRFCYLGEARLELFESMLDSDTYVLGVDEHTGLVINLDTEEAKVVGNGRVTIRLRSNSYVYESGSVIPLSTLRSPWSSLSLQGSNAETVAFGSNVSTSDSSIVMNTTTADPSGAHSSTPGSLDEVVLQTSTAFGTALDERDAERAVRAALDLESAIKDWSADTLQGDSIDRARGALRSMISRLGDAAVQGVQDPRSVVGPYIEAMLAVRATVRAEKRYDLSDVIRDAFVALNVEVRDTPQGVEWSLPE